MSRCFPFPPQGYVRNPVAAAEAEATTKLPKEREKAEKKKGETSKHSKRTHKKRKHEDISVAGQESKKVSKESVEQLEKSGLSEEHGAACFVQTVHDSPESSQDSSKRRKVVLPGPSQNKNGNVLRIKIKREQDSPFAMLEKLRVLEQPPVQQMGSGSSLLSKQNLSQPYHNKAMLKSAAGMQQSTKGDPQAVTKQASTQPPARIMQRVDPQTMGKGIQKIDPRLSVKATTGRVDPLPAKMMGRVDPSPYHNKAMLKSAAGMQQSIKGDPQAVTKQASTQPPAWIMQRVDPQTMGKGIQKIDPQLSVKAATGRVDPPPAKMMGRVDPSPSKVMGRADPSPAAKATRRVDPTLSSNVIQRDAPSCSKVLQKETSTAAFRQPQLEQPSLLQKPKLSPVNKQQQTNASLPKEETWLSGKKTEAAPLSEVKQSKSDRKKSRKTEKKEKNLRDLFVTWNPPSFEMEDMDRGDQDWLLASTRKPDAITSDCRASDGSLPFQSVEQQFSLHPRAIHLPDLHVYQLPYVVPF